MPIRHNIAIDATIITIIIAPYIVRQYFAHKNVQNPVTLCIGHRLIELLKTSYNNIIALHFSPDDNMVYARPLCVKVNMVCGARKFCVNRLPNIWKNRFSNICENWMMPP